MRFLEKAGNISISRLACGAIVCFFILSLVAMDTVQAADSQNCLACHDGTTDAPDVGLFNTSGHGRFGIDCIDCHDSSIPHDDGGRTYSFDSDYYAPTQSGVEYAAGYQLKYVNGEVPLMIPANYSITFVFDASLMRANAFRLCFDCHDSSAVLDNTPGDGLQTNFKASLPNPPRNYSYEWGSDIDVNEHFSHIMNHVGPFADSDWDSGTDGSGGTYGRDTLTTCTSCHNVHGAGGTHGSTNEAMIRDGSLAGRTGYGFSYVVEDVGNGGYPMVTSTGATQSTSVGAIFRNNTSNMCGGSMCHDDPAAPGVSSYDASGSGWGTYVEYYRPWYDYTDIDRDGDGYSSDVDCNDGDPDINPDATEECDGIDNNCDGATDEDFVDTDSDGDADCCDNCPLIANPEQEDSDDDGIGDACEVSTIDDILAFFDQHVGDDLYGRGRGWLAKLRLCVMRWMLEIAGEFIEQDRTNAACFVLQRAYKRCDDQPRPRDLVVGEATKGLAEKLYNLAASLGCKWVRPEYDVVVYSSTDEEGLWIHLELKDDEGNLMPYEDYIIYLPDGSVVQGTLDEDGYARERSVEPGTCHIIFPNRDKEAWERV
jgi:hypothetical protein